ncbi:MAG: putative transaldolase [candidate division TA06 bacterium 32_111]|uniref:Probable transaldolase n=3 Tax=Bacteria candidate phyla TaxID=1783234 RepID=A0A101I293_UNCT6|nr:MAG: putative transaldolase [candidate division TA06 bacterium 32_111]KUK87139.1 MAG: putative transaldolase [candidate division TA06 bacterium 34_109]HCP17131.1 fructose-6-phosphate aldolase [candidate division WOR-3 bacterium]
MKFFIDSANLDEIKDLVKKGIVDGVTTNPSLILKEKERTGKSFEEIVSLIASVVEGPISVEVNSLEYEGMIEEAKNLASISKNIVVKIPMTENGLKAVKTLKNIGIKTNVTLVFTPVQAVLAAKSGATYVSPFIGRIDDISDEGIKIIEKIMKIFKNYNFETKVIVASVRNPIHILNALEMGADIATIPYKVFTQLIKHPLTDLGIKRFLEDYEKSKN